MSPAVPTAPGVLNTAEEAVNNSSAWNVYRHWLNLFLCVSSPHQLLTMKSALISAQSVLLHNHHTNTDIFTAGIWQEE